MCDSSSDNESLDEPLSEICSAATISNTPLPEKSKHKYDKAYQDFISWKTSKNLESFEENVVLAYFQELSVKFKSSSLYTLYSMLKCTLCHNHEVDISRYSRLSALLKRKAVGSTVKKSKTFTVEDIQKFLSEANDREYLLTKVALIFGIVGACKRQELYRLQFKDVEVYESTILVKINKDKNLTPRTFSITGNYYELVKKYIKLRPDPCVYSSFFVHYKLGKCYAQNLGINNLGGLGKTIAAFLELPDPEMYTGNCFRRTSATLAVHADGDIYPLRRHIGRWKTLSDTENSINSSVNVECQEPSFENITVLSGHSNSTEDDYANNVMESSNEKSNRILNVFENKSIEAVNINIPSRAVQYDIDYTMETKDEVWTEIQSFQNQNNRVNSHIPSTTAAEKCTSDTESKNQMWDNIHIENLNTPNICESEGLVDKEKGQKTNHNRTSLEDSATKIVNINIPGESTDLQKSLSSLVRFTNCKIQNVNVYYTK